MYYEMSFRKESDLEQGDRSMFNKNGYETAAELESDLLMIGMNRLEDDDVPGCAVSAFGDGTGNYVAVIYIPE